MRNKNEFHYLQFEGKLPSIKPTRESIRNYMFDFEVDNWTITDIDNFMKGNKHNGLIKKHAG